MEERNRARYMGRGAELPGALQVSHFPQISSVCSPTWSYLNPFFQVFVEAALQKHRLLNHWPLLTELNLQLLPSPIPGGQG